MENKEREELDKLNEKHTPNPIETDYEANKENPGPAKEAVTEKNDEKAGRLQYWLLFVIMVVLLIFWLIYKSVFKSF
ncbi:hypothetical protein Pedsa_1086 [Pseudopedobacter saltans DSM 12145]|uniref:Uncharacterized protein n=1 Tax=Pseudopedobacter saltans (strain ATCC 51119 / DSM 12145 / JCM 21818 / CCUG 39354 / LMG 10337 / NBRC 100064 / NCIMB 13643) TaxID=762903 RepID=F0SBL0_PSESL|nr:hypothetical protein [Pseudopedobacter saltans]ADY51656.1 hypothetical protein Pedsa_1086 [Pseudopedobacter saltans DSM 12145]